MSESELAPVAVPGSSQVRSPANAIDGTELTEALTALEERIGRISRSVAGAAEHSAAISENVRIGGIREDEVLRAVEAIRADDSDEFQRSLLLRTVGEMIDRFGFPTNVYRESAGFSAVWSLEDGGLYANFIDGVVVSVHN